MSLEVFARVGGLDIQEPLSHVDNFIPLEIGDQRDSNIMAHTPLYHVVSDIMEKVEIEMFGAELQTNIDTMIYIPDRFEGHPKPRHWPKGKQYPSDSTLRRIGQGKCIVC